MIQPFVMVPMCDCTIDKASKKKTCVSFLRAFVMDDGNLTLVGEFDYNANPYKPLGEVSSEAKCCNCCDCHDCDCQDCGNSNVPSLACYDIHCLLNPSELNGGLSNLTIIGAGSLVSAAVKFDPPATSAQTVADTLNAIQYLGFESWTSSGPGLLCVQLKEGDSAPGLLTSCRFNRITFGNSQANWPNIIWHTVFENPGGDVNADSGAVLDPNNSSMGIADSHIHYFSNVELLDMDTGTTQMLAPANRTNTRLFRSSYNEQSVHAYVQLTPLSAVTDVLSGSNITSNFPAVINAIPPWLSSLLALQSIPAVVTIPQIAAPVSQVSLTRVPFAMAVDLPCRYQIQSIGNLMAMSPLEVSISGAISGTGLQAGHKFFFQQDTTAGTFTATPSFDGIGGSTNTDSDCVEVPVAG